MFNWRRLKYSAFGNKPSSSGFVSPDGKWYPVDFEQHYDFAVDMYSQLYGKLPKYGVLDSFIRKGWIRISVKYQRVGIIIPSLSRKYTDWVIEYVSTLPKSYYIHVDTANDEEVVQGNKKTVLDYFI